MLSLIFCSCVELTGNGVGSDSHSVVTAYGVFMALTSSHIINLKQDDCVGIDAPTKFSLAIVCWKEMSMVSMAIADLSVLLPMQIMRFCFCCCC